MLWRLNGQKADLHHVCIYVHMHENLWIHVCVLSVDTTGQCNHERKASSQRLLHSQLTAQHFLPFIVKDMLYKLLAVNNAHRLTAFPLLTQSLCFHFGWRVASSLFSPLLASYTRNRKAMTIYSICVHVNNASCVPSYCIQVHNNVHSGPQIDFSMKKHKKQLLCTSNYIIVPSFCFRYSVHIASISFACFSIIRVIRVSRSPLAAIVWTYVERHY